MMILRPALIGLTALYWGMALVLTHVPKPPAVGPAVSDKLQHFVGYGILAGLLYLTLWACRPGLRGAGFYVLVIASAYGVIDEWTQPWVGRACDMGDWLANTGGAMIAVGGLMAIRWLGGWHRRGGLVVKTVQAERSQVG